MRQFLLFLLAGAVGFGVDAFILYAGLFFHFDYFFARVISALLAIVVTWLLNRQLAFRSTASTALAPEFARYFVGNLVGLLINLSAYVLLFAQLPDSPLRPLLALVVGSAAGLTVNFLWAKFLAFETRERVGSSVILSLIMCLPATGFVYTVQWLTHFARAATDPIEAIRVGVSQIANYPWTDMAENAIIGFNLANGLVFERDTVVTHMPGVYQYLQPWLTAFGISDGTPSLGLASAAYAVSAFATAALEVVLVTTALLLLGIGTGSAVFGGIIVAAMAAGFTVAMPLSENILPWLILLQIVCLYVVVFRQATARGQILVTAWSMSALPFMNLMIGLTVFVSVAFLGALFALVAIWRFARQEWSPRDINWPGVAIPIVLCVGTLFYQLLTVDLNGLLFWNVTVNLNQITVNPIAVMISAFWLHWQHFFEFRTLKGGNLYVLIPLLLLFASGMWRRGATFPALFLFCGSCFAFAILTQWRSAEGFKAEMFGGVTWALIVILGADLIKKLSRPVISTTLALVFVIGSAIGVPSFAAIVRGDIGRHALPARNEPFDAANVCRFRQSTPCRCLQVTAFGPQIFLEHDVRQCRDRFSTFASVIFASPVNRANLIRDLDDPSVAFLRFPEQMLEIWPEHRDPKIMARLYGAQASCPVPFGGDAVICFASRN